MCLTANNVQWIKSPVCRSRDNSDENTAKRLPPTMQFKAYESNMSAQVGKCSGCDWSSLSPDRSCLCMPQPPQRSEATAGVLSELEGGLHSVWAEENVWRKRGWSAVSVTRKRCSAFEAAGIVCRWTTDEQSVNYEYEGKTCVATASRCMNLENIADAKSGIVF